MRPFSSNGTGTRAAWEIYSLDKSEPGLFTLELDLGTRGSTVHDAYVL